MSYADKSLIWGLKELRVLLAMDAELARKVKIIYVKTETIKEVSFKRYFGYLSALPLAQEGLQVKDPSIKKIKAILNTLGVETEHDNGVFIACGGAGTLNQSLQNNVSLFSQAQTLAANIQPDQSTNYAVFVDSDVKNDLIRALPTLPQTDTGPIDLSSDEDAPCDLAVFEQLEKSQRDPLTRFALLNQSTKKLLSFVDNSAHLNPNETRKYMRKIGKLIESHNFSIIKADESYRELIDNRTAEKKSLERKLDNKEKHMIELIEESERREKAQAEAIEQHEKTKSGLETELQRLRTLKLETKDDSKDEDIKDLETQIDTLKGQMTQMNAQYQDAEAQSRILISNLTDDKDELVLLLEKKVLELQRVENNYHESKQKASDLAKELEAQEFTPSKIYQKMAAESPPAPPTVRFNRRQPLSHEPSPQTVTQNIESPSPLMASLPKPSTYSFRDTHEQTPASINTVTPKQTNRKPIICKPANFGLNTWNPLTTDIYVHLDKAVKAGREALNVGATDTSVRRMILNSLGPKCDHVESFIENSETMTLEKFAESIGTILGKKSSVQMQSFLTAQRRSGEDLLAYFTRLHMLYRSSNKLTENKDWEQDATHSMSFYSKIFDACYQAQKTELIRKTEELLEKGNLTLPKLKSVLVDVNKIDATKTNAEEPRQEIALLDNKSKHEAENPVYESHKSAQVKWHDESQEDDKERSKKSYNTGEKTKKPLVCWYCATPGHTKLQCFKYIRRMKALREEKGEPREIKERGSQRRNFNKQKGAFAQLK